MKLKFIIYFASFLSITEIDTGCNKFVKVPEPINTITTAETFSSDATATEEVMGIYMDMVSGGTYADCYTSIFPGCSSDELVTFGSPTPFDLDNLQPNDGYP